jgi:2'-5' RNA ligase
MMSTYKQHFYFIAIIPPEPIYSEIKDFQRHVVEKYNSKEAFRRPSHATLIAPFQISELHEEALKSFIANFSSKQSPIELAIDGFGSFTTGVIYAAFVEDERLKKIQKELSLSFFKRFKIVDGSRPNYRFNAHMTIAFKDLSPLVFPDAWGEFKDKLYRRKWMLKDICLLRHNFTQWEIIKRAEFQSDKELSLGF